MCYVVGTSTVCYVVGTSTVCCVVGYLYCVLYRVPVHMFGAPTSYQVCRVCCDCRGNVCLTWDSLYSVLLSKHT